MILSPQEGNSRQAKATPLPLSQARAGHAWGQEEQTAAPGHPSNLSGHLTSAAHFYPEGVMSIFSSQGMLISTQMLGCPEIGLQFQTGTCLLAQC